MERDSEKLPWQKENKSQCLGNVSLPEAKYNVVNRYVVSRFWYINTEFGKSEKRPI